ncbi:MAG: hypothetical protein KGN00_13155, partial [Chloroflexota bacterium]|nr:hypothetical protein [Chloroflexota bacterium]
MRRPLAAGLALLLAACGGAASGIPSPSGTVEPPRISPTSVAASATSVGSGTIVVVGTVVPNATPPTPIPRTPTPSPAPGGLTQAQLKYRTVDQIGRPLFCDPDFYPIARADEQSLADQRFPSIEADAPTFA